ncbi:MAG: penicillin-binding transpeptidase domain-containing protein, partial [Pseudomonadota bacterium]
QAAPVPAGSEGAPRVIDARNAFIMTSLMQDVVRRGTAVRATQLGRTDLAGKTGTTNDQMDAWFCGYQPSLVAVSWIGYDTPRTLGNHETGAVAALPIWMTFMGKALQNIPEATLTPPEGVVGANVNPENGLRRTDGTGIYEYFYAENLPPLDSSAVAARPPEEIKEQLF